MDPLTRTRDRARRHVAKLLTPATYRVTGSALVRAGAAASAGATSMTFNAVPASYPATTPGDTFQIGTTKHTITNTVAAAGGTMAGVTFTPALAANVLANQQITVATATVYSVGIIAKQMDGETLLSSVYAGGDWQVMVFDLPIEPKPGHRIEWQGRTVILASGIGRDEAGAAWTVQAKAA